MSGKEQFVNKLNEEFGMKLSDADLNEVVGGIELGSITCPKCGGKDFKVFTVYQGHKVFCKNCIHMIDVDEATLKQYLPESTMR